ncbi:MAG: TonB-dependent receptor [Deltaproteobacteria bacterium]|nr:TonB-dependent receptor [Deltaproteobacteria bacterium]
MLKRLLWIVLGLLLATPALGVELKGQIKGTVTDGSGGPVPGVVVEISSPALQGTRGDTTDASGSFRVVGLPPGVYRIEASKPAFQKWTARDVYVAAGATVTVQIPLTQAVAGEEIVVEETVPVVDVTSTRRGVTFTKEMLRDIPNAGRDYQTTVVMSPGVVGGGNPNIGGGLDTSNQFYVDGVNTTDPITNTFSMNMNFDAIEEIQVITGGMDAEYGRALGGAINMITRSGGNEFHGDVQILYSSDWTRVFKPLPEEDPKQLAYDDQSLALNVGGPILKDRLWYFASLQGNYYLSQVSVPSSVVRPVDLLTDSDAMLPRKWRSAYLFGKLTFRPSPDHQLWLHAQADPTAIDNVEQSVYTLPSGETYWEQGGWLASLGHLWTASRSTVLETQAYVQANRIYNVPNTWLDCEDVDETGDCNDDDAQGGWFAYDPDGFSYGSYPYGYETRRNRASLNSKLTQYVKALGEHEFKAGVQAEWLHSYTRIPGLEDGYQFWTYTTTPDDLSGYVPALNVVYDSNLEADLQGWLASGFLQDVWQIGPVTLRPGVRVDWSQILNDYQEPVFQKVAAAPRFGAAWDVTRDGRTNLHAYYGRFYDTGFLSVASFLTENPGGYKVYAWDAEAGDWSDTPLYAVASRNLTVGTDTLKNPYSDEFDVGIEREVADGWSVDATFVYEKAHNFWEDDEVNLIWSEDGSEVIGYRNGTAEAIYRMRTPDEVYTSYTALTLAAEKQFDERWGMIASYTWSRAYGTQDDQSATAFFDIPEQRRFEEGLLGYDVPHAVKLMGSYREPRAWDLGGGWGLGYLVGWDFRLRSGYPYRRIYYNSYYDDWVNYGDDGDEPARMPAFSMTNLKAGLTVDALGTSWDLTAECFNVFNDRTITAVNTTYADKDGTPYLDSDGDILFGTPTSRQAPRYFQFGLRGEF